jgi:lipopolysaccharide/colanic/teichoic acid biosynthesis glycosyltransferase
LDLIVASLGVMILAPVLLSIAAAIRIGSPGPAVFRQPRMGRTGREFEIFKFRSMVVDAEQKKAALAGFNEAGDGLFKIANDPRVTRIGLLLRRLSLDELPQLFNVLKGDMSLVGPRPLPLDEDRLIAGWDRRRLAMPPGMTGVWQVLGSSRVPVQEMVKLDYLYAANWSLWGDIKLLIRTLPVIYGRRGL